MIRISWLFVFVVFPCSSIVQGNFQFSCPPNEIQVQPPFTNDTVFTFSVDITVAEHNVTLHGFEFSDADFNITRRHVTFLNDNGVWITEEMVDDYENMQTFWVNLETNSCTVSELHLNQTYSLFGLGIEKGFVNPNYTLHFWKQLNYTQILQNRTILSVDGIPVTQYHACVTVDGGKTIYETDLFFSDASWNLESNGPKLLQLNLQANQTSDGKTFNASSYIYTFHGGDKNVDSHWRRELPYDIVCSGRKDAPDFPYSSFPYYEMAFDIFDVNTSTVASFYEYVDDENKLFRWDMVKPANNSHAITYDDISIIHDFHAGIAYSINRDRGDCVIEPISDKDFWDFDVAHDKNSTKFHMKSITELWAEMNFTYYGRHTNSFGVVLDSWMSDQIMRNYSSQVLWLTQIMYMASRNIGDGKKIPYPYSIKQFVVTTVKGKNYTSQTELNLSGMKTKRRPNVFSVETCYNMENRSIVVVKFAEQYKGYVVSDPVTLDLSIRKAFAKAANVSIIRVSGYVTKQVGKDFDDKDADENLFVAVTLFEKPPVQGDTSEMEPQVNLSVAIEKLHNTVKQNMLLVEFTSVKGEVQMTAFSDYFQLQENIYTHPSSHSDTKRSGLSSGAIVALCIAMLVTGFLLGTIICHFKYKRGQRQFGYTLQD